MKRFMRGSSNRKRTPKVHALRRRFGPTFATAGGERSGVSASVVFNESKPASEAWAWVDAAFDRSVAAFDGCATCTLEPR